MNRRVAITGLGVVSPVGIGKENYWRALEAGKNGVERVTQFDPTDYSVKIAGEVRDFDPALYMAKKDAKRSDRVIQFSTAAATLAMEDSQLDPASVDPWRFGVYMGSGTGGLHTSCDGLVDLLEKGPRHVSPFAIPMMISNMVSAYVAIKYGCKGPNMCLVTACASSINSIGEAAGAISRGTAEEFVLQAPSEHKERFDDDILTIGEDVKGVNYKLARCCNPIFGDRIEGFIASDGAIKIHRTDCKNLRHLKQRYPYRIIRTRWTGKAGSQFVATLKVLGRDDIGIVSSITSVINKTEGCLLRSISVQAEGGLFEGMITVNIKGIALLDELIKKIQGVKGVKQVDRL